MSTPKLQNLPTEESEIAKFYKGRSVLITGAAGFVGSVLLEILLRCCPGIRHIFIVLRARKGMQPEERKEATFKKEIFFSIRENNPELFEKVIVVKGDTSQANLGMNDDDCERVRQEVSIVFHVAAAINFLRTLRFLLEQNFVATKHIIDFCRSIKKLDALIYTSTAYSNSNYSEITEKIYKMTFPTSKVMDTVETGTDEDLLDLYDKTEPKFLNYYTFTKCLAENLFADTARDLPVSIVRPSVIGSAWKGALPGYVDGMSGIMCLGMGVGRGFVRVARIDVEKRLDYVPVDTVANAHVVAAFLQATERLPSPFIYNCVISDTKSLTWGGFFEELQAMIEKHPLPNAFQKPSLTLCNNALTYWTYAIINHYIPAIVIDMILRIMGKEPKLFNMYRLFDKVVSVGLPFSSKEWDFKAENFKSLESKLNAKDIEMFPTALDEFTYKEVSRTLPKGAPMYKWESDKRSYKERQSTAYVRFCFTSLIKWSAIGSFTALLYALIF